MDSQNPNEQIRKRCDTAGYTRADIARHVGVSKFTVDNWFSAGRAIPPAKLRAIEALLAGGTMRVARYDDVMAFAVRLTPQEYQQLCAVAGAENLSAEEVESAVRELLQRTWDTLAEEVPQVVEEERALEAAEETMPAPALMPVPFIPAAHGNNGSPQC